MENVNELDKIIEKIKSYNSHWTSGHISQDILSKPKRKYFDLLFPLVKQLEVTRAVILLGPRRVGKTILLQQCISELIKLGTPPTNINYLSLDDPLFYKLSLDDFLKLFQQIFKDTSKDISKDKSLDHTFFIFDEIQYLEHWDSSLKILVDHYPTTKFIASGSAAGVLRRQSIESGAGRFTDFMLPAITFYEYLELLNLTQNLIIFNDKGNKGIASKDINALNQEFLNYLNYGGFPEAIFNESVRDNSDIFIRQDIIDKVLLKDLPALYGIDNIPELNRIFGYLCYRTGLEISYEALSNASNVSKNTLKKYIEYLEAAFLIRIIKRVDESGKTFKRENFFKVYITNPSMYSAIYGKQKDENENLGNLVETSIFSQFIHDTEWLHNLYYARFSKGKGEVDMVYLDQHFKIPWCLEIKWSDRYVDKISELKSLLSFCQLHKPKLITVSTKTIQRNMAFTDFDIQFKEAALICFNIGFTSIRKSKTHSSL